MENWGLITYRETALLIAEATASVTDRMWVAIVIAHEMSHLVRLRMAHLANTLLCCQHYSLRILGGAGVPNMSQRRSCSMQRGARQELVDMGRHTGLVTWCLGIAVVR